MLIKDSFRLLLRRAPITTTTSRDNMSCTIWHFKKFNVVMDERMDEMHLSVFHSVSNRAHGRRSRNSISSAAYAFNSFFFLLFFREPLSRE